MRTLTCALVEDSNVHRILLEKTIEKNNQLELKYSFNNGIDALKILNFNTIDILFLDIEMPLMNGFEFLSRLQSNPQIVITSQNPIYALQAYEFNVTDYLLKPFTKIRFDIAIKKAKEKVKTTIQELPEHKIIVKHNLKQVELNIHTILWIEALGDYVKVITRQRNYVVLSTLSAFQKKIGKQHFLRIHKSYIVNLKMVERYNHQYIEIHDKKLPISRTKNLELDKLLNYLD
ncbi:LytR/AlgR family response regulator transcription factor [Maribacter sp. X9]|uniref:LytR/AlgR family response regulator transcription factor n=1 Tax=Maribacter sp. X9 TaxID=3402159 RepID=UPI003AF37D86